MKNWIEQLQPIITEYKDGDAAALTTREADKLLHIIKAKVYLQEGIITPERYEGMLDEDLDFEDAVENAAHYLANDYLEIPGVIRTIEEAAETTDGYDLIDDLEGVMVWEPLEGRMTINRFLELIGR